MATPVDLFVKQYINIAFESERDAISQKLVETIQNTTDPIEVRKLKFVLNTLGAPVLDQNTSNYIVSSKSAKPDRKETLSRLKSQLGIQKPTPKEQTSQSGSTHMKKNSNPETHNAVTDMINSIPNINIKVAACMFFVDEISRVYDKLVLGGYLDLDSLFGTLLEVNKLLDDLPDKGFQPRLEKIRNTLMTTLQTRQREASIVFGQLNY